MIQEYLLLLILLKSSVVLTSNLINNPIGIDNNQGYADDDSIRSLTS